MRGLVLGSLMFKACGPSRVVVNWLIRSRVRLFSRLGLCIRAAQLRSDGLLVTAGDVKYILDWGRAEGLDAKRENPSHAVIGEREV